MIITDQLQQKVGESDFDYHKRLIRGKLVDKTLADIDYSELSKLVYGVEYSGDVARRMFYGSNRTLDLMEKECLETSSDAIMSEMDAKMIEIRKERQKLFDQRTAFNKLVRDRSRQEELNDIIESAICENKLPQLTHDPVPVRESDNDLLVSLSDIHYGATHSNYWNTYNSDVCARMFEAYIGEIIKIAERHNSENC